MNHRYNYFEYCHSFKEHLIIRSTDNKYKYCEIYNSILEIKQVVNKQRVTLSTFKIDFAW